MTISHTPNLPPTYGKIVEEYKKQHQLGEYVHAYTVLDNLKILEVKGIIQNNKMYHPHFNLDNSEDELFIRYVSGKSEKRWWTTDFCEAVKIRVQNINEWTNKLNKELAYYNGQLIEKYRNE